MVPTILSILPVREVQNTAKLMTTSPYPWSSPSIPIAIGEILIKRNRMIAKANPKGLNLPGAFTVLILLNTLKNRNDRESSKSKEAALLGSISSSHSLTLRWRFKSCKRNSLDCELNLRNIKLQSGTACQLQLRKID